MSPYANLLGHEYDFGRVDCFSCIRNYYAQVWDLHLPNFARPNQFWIDPHLDLYSMFRDWGFELLDKEDPGVGDGLIMQLATTVPAHGAVLVEPNKILHHLPRRLSTVDRFKPSWSSKVVNAVRHPMVYEKRMAMTDRIEFYDIAKGPLFRDPRFQEALEKARSLGSEPGAVRSNQ